MKNVNLTVRQTAYGHWQATIDYYKKRISGLITCAPDIDDYQSEDDRRKTRGYKAIVRQVKMQHAH